MHADYKGYRFYDDGKVFNSRKNPKQLTPFKNNENQLQLLLFIDGIRKVSLLGRWLYNAFYPFDMSDKNLWIHYKDGDTTNCSLDNLALMNKNNILSMERTKTKLSTTMCNQIEKDYYINGKKMKDIANDYNLSYSSVNKIVNKYCDKKN